MYHLELRHFPHNMSRFNLTEAELRPIVELWARGQVIDLGEHRWNPREAQLTILEGPEIPLGQLTMGRGWRTAERQGTDVTQRLLDAARQALFAGWSGQAEGAVPHASPPQAGPGAVIAARVDPPGTQGSPPGAAALGDPLALGMQMAALLGPDAIRLLDAWRLAAARSPGIPPSQALAEAEQALRSAGGTDG
jgi:hypothetical protein